jgi:hypothetical protein
MKKLMGAVIAAGAAMTLAPAAHAAPGGAGTLDDWIAQVCMPGTFQGGSGGGPVQPHATWHGGCVASTPHAAPIFIGRYASRPDAVYDLTHLSDFYHTRDVVGPTTAAQMEDGTGIEFTAPLVPQPGPVPDNALYSLTRFGFRLESIPRQEPPHNPEGPYGTCQEGGACW